MIWVTLLFCVNQWRKMFILKRQMFRGKHGKGGHEHFLVHLFILVKRMSVTRCVSRLIAILRKIHFQLHRLHFTTKHTHITTWHAHFPLPRSARKNQYNIIEGCSINFILEINGDVGGGHLCSWKEWGAFKLPQTHPFMLPVYVEDIVTRATAARIWPKSPKSLFSIAIQVPLWVWWHDVIGMIRIQFCDILVTQFNGKLQWP